MRLRCQRRQNIILLCGCSCVREGLLSFIKSARNCSRFAAAAAVCVIIAVNGAAALSLLLVLPVSRWYLSIASEVQATHTIRCHGCASLDALLSKFRFRLKRVHYLSLLLLFPCAFLQTSSVSSISFALDSSLYGSGSDQADIVGRVLLRGRWIGRKNLLSDSYIQFSWNSY